jgi:hypothetical protein
VLSFSFIHYSFPFERDAAPGWLTAPERAKLAFRAVISIPCPSLLPFSTPQARRPINKKSRRPGAFPEFPGWEAKIQKRTAVQH